MDKHDWGRALAVWFVVGLLVGLWRVFSGRQGLRQSGLDPFGVAVAVVFVWGCVWPLAELVFHFLKAKEPADDHQDV